MLVLKGNKLPVGHGQIWYYSEQCWADTFLISWLVDVFHQHLDREKNHIGFAEPRLCVVNLEWDIHKNCNCPPSVRNDYIKDAGSLLICFILSRLFKIGWTGSRISFPEGVWIKINVYVSWISYWFYWKALMKTDSAYRDFSLPLFISTFNQIIQKLRRAENKAT